jgi:hypothetical protein
VGKLLYTTVGGGVAEGAGVGIIGVLADPQAVQANNPIKLLSRNIHLFFIASLAFNLIY